MNNKTFLKNKNITLMRIGLLGRGVGDAAFLAKQGAQVLVVDSAPQSVMQPSVDKLTKYKNIRFKFGPYDLADFRNCDMVLKGAGTPRNSPEIAEAKKHNIPVEMSASLFAKFADVPIIGVTGTRGKSTVTHLISHILQTAGKKVLLGGNVLGVSTLALLPKAKNADYALFELDSWQLQGFGDNKISPHIAVFTTFYPDHLNYYDGSMENYFADKANIFSNQKGGRALIDGARHDFAKSDILITGKQVLPRIKKWKGKIQGTVISPKSMLPQGFKLSIPGDHNVYNAALAIEVARQLGIKDAIIKKAVKSFKGVPGRLELIRTVKGILFYNDTTSTTPEATIAALQALGNEKRKNIILIAGGSEKNLDMSALFKKIPTYTKAVILLAGAGTDRVKGSVKNYVEADSMKSAVSLACSVAKRGDIVLLSPAFASFGMFKNEFDRGDQFNNVVKKIV